MGTVTERPAAWVTGAVLVVVEVYATVQAPRWGEVKGGASVKAAAAAPPMRGVDQASAGPREMGMGTAMGEGMGDAEGCGDFSGDGYGMGDAEGCGDIDGVHYGYGDRVGTGPFGCGDADGDGGIHGRGNG